MAKNWRQGGLEHFRVKTALFKEDATSTVHTATFNIPSGWTVYDIVVVPQVLWTATTSAELKVGDTGATDGFFSAVALQATDLVLGERLHAIGGENWGATNGTYLTTAGRFGQQSGDDIGGYMPNAYTIVGTVTVVDPVSTAGRTRMTVIYYRGATVTPVLT